jgi:hypothetical protein
VKHRSAAILLVVLLVCCSTTYVAQETFRPLRGPYMGHVAGDVPAVFLPGKISSGHDEGCSVFLPGARSFLWRVVRGDHDTLLLLEDVDGRWQPPRPIAFVGDRGEVWDFTIAPGGDRLLFTSNAPVERAARGNLWSVGLGPEAWGEARPLGPPVNTVWHESHPSIDRDGVLYFFRTHPEDRSVTNIYAAEPGAGGFSDPVALPAPVNGEFPDYDPFIAADGSYLIFSSRRPGGQGAGDLYVSFRGSEGSWGDPINLGPPINSPAEENRPSVTLDGEYFFFTSDRENEVRLPPGVPPASSMPGRGSRDIYWMKADFIRSLRTGDD